MKSACLVLLFLATAAAQQSSPVATPQPNCLLNISLQTAGQNSPAFDNRQVGCLAWTVAVAVPTTVSALQLVVQTAQDNGSASCSTCSWATFTAATGSNPNTDTAGWNATFTTGTSVYYGYLRVRLISISGTGSITGKLFSFLAGATGGGGGGGGSGVTSVTCGYGLTGGTFTTAGTCAEQPTIFNVYQYGCVADGVTDNAPCIQATFNAAKAAGGGTVYFPCDHLQTTCTYLLSTFHHPTDPGTAMVGLSDFGSNWTINIKGEGATLTTAQTGTSGMILIELDGGWSNSLVSGLTFVNTHGITANPTTVLAILGGGGQLAAHNRIENCTFQDSSRMIEVAGVTDLVIDSNTFLLNGRDHGTGASSDPNVGIRAFDNTPNGYSDDVKITKNHYDGCSSGTLSGATNKTCGDGFIYGMYRSLIATGNDGKRWSQELIFTLADNAGGTFHETGKTNISLNTGDATIVTGDTAGGGNYFIRADQSNTTIASNTCLSCMIGIWTYRPDYSITGQNLDVHGNNIVFATGSQTSSFGVGVLGMLDVSVVGNHFIGNAPTVVSGGPLAGIYVTGLNSTTQVSDRVHIANNSQYVATAPTGGYRGVWLQFVQTAEILDNEFKNLTYCGYYVNGFSLATAPLITQAGNSEGCTTAVGLSGTAASMIQHGGPYYVGAVASLPPASGQLNVVYEVTDGLTSSDCTVGGGSTRLWCVSNGSAWILMGGGGTSSGGGGITIYSGSTSLSGTLYFPLGGGSLPSSTEADVAGLAPVAGTIANFTANLSAAPGVGNSVAFTLRDNASSQSVTCTISGTATSCSDLTHSFTPAQLDKLDIQAVVTGAPAGLPILVMEATFGGSGSSGGSGTGGITVYSGASALASTLYFPVGGGSLPSATEAQAGTFSPTAATVSNFYVNISAAVGLGNSVVFTWRDATVSQTLTCTISGAVATSCSDTTHSFTTVAGDKIDIQAVATGTIAGTPVLIMSASFGGGGGGGGGGGSTTTLGPVASLPGTVPAAGNTYQTTDSWYRFVSNGTAWLPFVGNVNMTLPPTTGWTFDNQAGTTVSTAKDAIFLLNTGGIVANTMTAYYRTVNATPYTYHACFYDGAGGGGGVNGGVGIGVADNSGKYTTLQTIHSPNSFLDVLEWSSTGAVSAAPWIQGGGTYEAQTPICLAISDDGTNRTYSWAPDQINYIVLYSEPDTTFLTATRVAIVMRGNGTATNAPSGVISMTLVNWNVTASGTP